jgi:SagB-type dehydrogenase family enzyme
MARHPHRARERLAADERGSLLYKRASSLVCYWRDGEFVVRDYLRNVEREASSGSVALLALLSDWASLSDLAKATTPSPVPLKELRLLVRSGFVETSNQPADPRHEGMADWAAWSPEAALLHFGTKDPRFSTLQSANERIDRLLELEDYPDTLKYIPGAARRTLPTFPRAGPWPELLLARRTWRRFGKRPLTIEQLATLLGLTWGVQNWMEISDRVRAPVKTSPSGGACHSIEVYIVASKVDGLRRGIYHYCPDTHELETVSSRLRKGAIAEYLARQPWFSDCGALFFMTSVFGRVKWKYRFPRAYRVLTLEAGHFCQTFCLTATWLGLAPFCTAAFADSVIERDLRVDGIHEGLLYTAGVGTRPLRPGKHTARSIRQVPPLSPPAYLEEGKRCRKK